MGFRGRRDAWLLVLLGEVGLTRRAATQVTTSDIRLTETGLLLAGHEVPTAAQPLACPRCAATRWIRAAILAQDWGRASLRAAFMSESPTPAEHDCETPLPPNWNEIWELLPAVDRHGWTAPWRPMSLRSVSAVLAYRQAATMVSQPEEPRGSEIEDCYEVPEPSPWRNLSMDELLERLDEQMAATDEVLRRVEAAVADDSGDHRN